MKVGILGVNKAVEDYEREVCNYIKTKLKDLDVEVINSFDIKSNSVDEVIDNVISKSEGKIILIADAEVGKNFSLAKASKKLYNQDIRPFVVVTHVEKEGVEPIQSGLNPAEYAVDIDPDIDWIKLNYETIYFDFAKKNARWFLGDDSATDEKALFDGLMEYIKQQQKD